MRHRLPRRLHPLGIHVACRSRRESMQWVVPMRMPDGSTWTPEINGIPPSRSVHF